MGSKHKASFRKIDTNYMASSPFKLVYVVYIILYAAQLRTT